MNYKIEAPVGTKSVRYAELAVGDITRIVHEDFSCKGHIIVKSASHCLSLTNPSVICGNSSFDNINVVRLSPGEKVVLTVI